MIILIILLGFLVRLISLNQSLWLDEAITALAIKNNTYTQLITIFAKGDFHPPLYYLILKFWASIFGYSEISLRFPSILFSLITAIFIYLLAKKFFNHKVGLLAGLFFVINPLAVYYAQEARMYSLAMMLVVGSMWFLITKKWFWFVLFTVLSIYTDYLPFLMFPVYFLVSQDKKKVFYPLVFFLPWLPALYDQLKLGLGVAANNPLWSDVVGAFSFKALPLFYVKFIIGRISLDNKWLYGLLLVPTSLGFFFTQCRARVKTLWIWFLVPIVFGLGLAIKISIFSYFRFLFVLPAFILLLAGGAKNKWLSLAVVAVSGISLMVFNLNTNYHREDWRGLVAYVQKDPGIVVMPSLAQSAPLQYYGATNLMDKDNLNFNTKSVYLIRYVQEIFDPQDIELQALEKSVYNRVEEKSFNGVVVWKLIF